MPNLGGGEPVIVLLIVLLIFGGTKVSQLTRSLGQAQREFRRGAEDPGDDKGRTKDTKPST